VEDRANVDGMKVAFFWRLSNRRPQAISSLTSNKVVVPLLSV
jgi:hypothetical protein